MAVNRANIVDQNFTDTISSFVEGAAQPDLNQPVRPGFRLTGRQAIALFETMVSSRHLDLASRVLKAEGQSFYTIGSSGHEANAVVVSADKALYLMYSSGSLPPQTNPSLGDVTRSSVRSTCGFHPRPQPLQAIFQRPWAQPS